ncbi:MAG: hypothetical protein RSB71_00295 [Bacilli bacterium]
MNNYLIPANSKKSMLIFGLFNKFDLILFLSGVGLSIILLLALPLDNMVMAVIALIPGMITGFLVMPVPNYYNIRTLLTSAFQFLTGKRKFIWKGWCVPHGEDKE